MRPRYETYLSDAADAYTFAATALTNPFHSPRRLELEPQVRDNPNIEPELVAEYLSLPGAMLDVVAENPGFSSDLCLVELGTLWPDIPDGRVTELIAKSTKDFWLRQTLKKRAATYIEKLRQALSNLPKPPKHGPPPFYDVDWAMSPIQMVHTWATPEEIRDWAEQLRKLRQTALPTIEP